MSKRKGRKRKNAARYSGGRLAQKPQKERVDETIKVAIEARQRIFGLKLDDAKHEDAGDMLGRLRLSGEISTAQHEAGERYAECRAEYHRVMLARPVPSAGDLQRQPGFDNSDGSDAKYAGWCRQVSSDYKAMRKAVLECGDSNASLVLDGIIDGAEMFDFVGTLRVALNAIARIGNRRRAA